jgi:rhodanese-related sulfurtransferase
MMRALLAMLLMLTALSSAQAEYRSPETVEGATTISAEQARAMFDQGEAFIDVRNPKLYARKHIPGAHHLDLKYVYSEATLGKVAAKGQPIIIYCSGVKCSRSYRAAEKALSWGYQKVYYFRGGIVDWKKAGYPTETSN